MPLRWTTKPVSSNDVSVQVKRAWVGLMKRPRKFVGTFGMDVGTYGTPLLYALREREAVLDLLVLPTGVRMNPSYIRFGGVARDAPPEFFPQLERWETEARRFTDADHRGYPAVARLWLGLELGEKDMVARSAERYLNESMAWTEAWEDPNNPDPLPMPLHGMLIADAQRRMQRSAATNPGANELVNYFVGQVVGSMNQVKPAKQVVYEMVEEFIDAAERVAHLLDD